MALASCVPIQTIRDYEISHKASHTNNTRGYCYNVDKDLDVCIV